MLLYSGALGVLWTIFIAVWLVGALTAKRTVYRSWSSVWWRVCMIVSVLVFFKLLRGSSYLTGALSIPALNVLGVVCTVVGFGLAVWARVYLGRNWGMPMTVKENHELVTSGPYIYLRNPIYTGVLLALLGSALVDWWWAVIFVWSAAYFVYALRGEERLMLKEFPDTYPAYKAHTWRLIPWVY